MYSVGWVLSVAVWDPNLMYVSSIVAPLYFGSHLLRTINNYIFVGFSPQRNNRVGGNTVLLFPCFLSLSSRLTTAVDLKGRCTEVDPAPSTVSAVRGLKETALN